MHHDMRKDFLSAERSKGLFLAMIANGNIFVSLCLVCSREFPL